MVLLPNIPRGPTWTEEHRHQCLVLSLAKRDKAARIDFFGHYERKHGKAAAERLHREVLEAWKALKRSS